MKIKGNDFFINKCNEPTGDGTTTFNPTVDWLSQVSLQPITPVRYSKHECGIPENTSIKTHQGLLEATHLNQSNSDSTSWSDITKTIIRLVSIQAFQGFQSVCPAKASRIINSTHNFLGLHSIFPT